MKQFFFSLSYTKNYRVGLASHSRPKFFAFFPVMNSDRKFKLLNRINFSDSMFPF
jgi:hypothetical protein